MSSITTFFKPAPKPEDAAAAAAPNAPAQRYELLFSRTSKVVQWDNDLFTDCRQSEAEDAQDETIRMAKRYDSAEREDDSMSFLLPEEAHDALYDSKAEANEVAKQLVELQLQGPLNCEIAQQEQVSNGELPPGYQLPPADSVAKETAMLHGCGTYTGSNHSTHTSTHASTHPGTCAGINNNAHASIHHNTHANIHAGTNPSPCPSTTHGPQSTFH